MAGNPHTAKGEGGFTLLEVLVAFSIAALALGVMYRIYAKGAASAILGKEYAQAVAIADSKLAVAGVDESLNIDNTSGTENDKYEWQMSISDYEPGAEQDQGFEQPLQLKEIELVITWNSLGRRHSFKIHTLRPVPPQR